MSGYESAAGKCKSYQCNVNLDSLNSSNIIPMLGNGRFYEFICNGQHFTILFESLFMFTYPTRINMIKAFRTGQNKIEGNQIWYNASNDEHPCLMELTKAEMTNALTYDRYECSAAWHQFAYKSARFRNEQILQNKNYDKRIFFIISDRKIFNSLTNVLLVA